MKAVADQSETFEQAISSAQQTFSTMLDKAQGSITSSVKDEVTTATGSQIAELKSEMEQTYSDLSLKFTGVDDLRSAQAQTAGRLSQFMQYFRFSADGLLIGKTDSPTSLKLSNNELEFLQGQSKVAWFDSKTLNVSNAKISGSLRLGNYAIFSNVDGSVDIKKVN